MNKVTRRNFLGASSTAMLETALSQHPGAARGRYQTPVTTIHGRLNEIAEDLRATAHVLFSLRRILVFFLIFSSTALLAQMDQGSIGGEVKDNAGAVIPGAQVILTSTDTGVTFQAKTDASGIYTFPPAKIGTYKLTASAPGFSTLNQENIHLDLQAHLNIVLVLQPGIVSQTVTVSSAPPLMQSQDASVGQVMSTVTIDHTPLNGRNWVYIAQLAPGVAPGNQARGQGKGDFDANGQQAEQNDFLLNGVDNNSYARDYMNGSSYVVQPPPDALSEFKIQTADFSAEFGHSAGAVINAAIKSGTNRIHGDLWEYWRNDVLDARDWDALTVPEYRENQFGATLGAPILHDKLFFFGYAEANRIVFGNTKILNVPSALMRQGNFSELLNPALTSTGHAIQLYQPGSAGTQPLSCNGKANVFCAGQINPIAQKILNLYPLPNANGAALYNNYVVNQNDTDNTWQWGTRIDWNISSKNQAFAAYSYSNEVGGYPPPLGPIIDGGTYGSDGQNNFLSETLTFSDTNEFNPSFDNEFRFGFTYGKFAFLQPGSTQNTSAQLGLGGIPYNSITLGGLPLGAVTGLTNWGTPNDFPAEKDMDVINVLDNITKILGNHSIRTGFYFSHALMPILVANFARGKYTYSGYFTSVPGKSNTGYGVGDFLADQMASANLGSNQKFDLLRSNFAGYVQDDWRITPRLTLNLGLRYEYFTPPAKEAQQRMANFVINGAIAPGTGQATLLYSNKWKNQTLAPAFTQILAANNVSIAYSGNQYLANSDYTDIAPRLGFAYMLDPRTVLRGGFGMFYGIHVVPSLQQNYPFQFASTFNKAAVCKPGNCGTDGITLAQGFTQQIAAGLANAVTTPTMTAEQTNGKTTYTTSYNLSLEHSLTPNLSATIAYVGASMHRVAVQLDGNSVAALTDPRLSSTLAQPFPGLGADTYVGYEGKGSYNALQTTLQKRFVGGLDFLATYTWAHSLDDAVDPLQTEGSGYRAPNIVGISQDYSDSVFDVRNRVTFNAYYQLPFGSGRRFLNSGGIVNRLLGGWAGDLEFTAQTGFPFTVSDTLGTAGPNGASANAVPVANPFAPGGTSQVAGVTCATRTRTVQHWYNPCAFANPPAAFPAASVSGSPISTTKITGLAALPYLGGRRYSVPGPGYERINMSLFKQFPTFRKQYVEFRADAFNVLNTPTYGLPSVANNGSNGGQITGTQFFQNLTPDARFFQLSARYVF